MTDYSSLEKLYTNGIIDINPKDYINGTTSNVQPKQRADVFLPDNRFVTVDGTYIRDQLDKDLFQYNKGEDNINAEPWTSTPPSNQNDTKNKVFTKLKNALTSNIAAGIVGTAALLVSARYILKKLHIIK